MKTKALLLVLLTAISSTACTSKPPETVVERKWEVDPETGNYEEKEKHSTTIFVINEDDDMPELKLPKSRTSKK